METIIEMAEKIAIRNPGGYNSKTIREVVAAGLEDGDIVEINSQQRLVRGGDTVQAQSRKVIGDSRNGDYTEWETVKIVPLSDVSDRMLSQKAANAAKLSIRMGM